MEEQMKKRYLIIIFVLITIFIFLSCSNTQRTSNEEDTNKDGETTQEDNTPKINKMSKNTQQDGKVIYYYDNNHPDFNGYKLKFRIEHKWGKYFQNDHFYYAKWYVDEKKVEICWKDDKTPGLIIEWGKVNPYNSSSIVSIKSTYYDASLKEILLDVYSNSKENLDLAIDKIDSSDRWDWSDGELCRTVEIYLYSPKKN